MNDKHDSPIDENVRKAAVEAIKAKANSLIEERQAIRDEMAALDQRLRRNEISIFDCRGAARLFNADIDLPEDLATARAVWVRRVMNDPQRPPGSEAPARPQGSFIMPSAVLLGGEQKTLLGGLLGPSEPSVREIALQQLKRAGDAGSRASTIRQVVESIIKKKVHEKTVGMNFYRLSRDKLVRREGQTWFFVPSVAEAKNPAVARRGLSKQGPMKGGRDLAGWAGGRGAQTLAGPAGSLLRSRSSAG